MMLENNKNQILLMLCRNRHPDSTPPGLFPILFSCLYVNIRLIKRLIKAFLSNQFQLIRFSLTFKNIFRWKSFLLKLSNDQNDSIQRSKYFRLGVKKSTNINSKGAFKKNTCIYRHLFHSVVKKYIFWDLLCFKDTDIV